jgi:hypothetical protein
MAQVRQLGLIGPWHMRDPRLSKGAAAVTGGFDSALKSGAIPEDSIQSLAYRIFFRGS